MTSPITPRQDWPFAATNVDAEPPATEPQQGSAPAAPAVSEPREYGFKRRKESDVELPTGSFVRVRQLSTTQVIQLGVLNMKDAFGADLLKNINGDDQAAADAAMKEAERWVTDPAKTNKVIGTLDRIAEASVLCPKVVLHGESNDSQMNAKDIEIVDKWAIFEAAMPNEMKEAAQEAQHAALKSV